MIGGHGGNIFALARRLGCAPEDILDLSSNVNPLGPPPGLREHLAERLDAIAVLPEVDSRDIVERYAARLGLPAERMAAGNGTTQFIYSIPSTLKTRRALIVGPTYSDYADSCRLQGVAPGFLLGSDADGFRADPQRLSDAAAGADTVFVCNPNNPTGATHPGRGPAAGLRRPPARALRRRRVLPAVRGRRGPAEPRRLRARERARPALDLQDLPHPGPAHRLSRRRPGRDRAVQERALALERQRPRPGGGALHLRIRRRPSTRSRPKPADHLDRERRDLQERLAASPACIPYPSTVSFMLARLPDGLSAAAAWSRLAAERILIRDCSNFVGLSERFIRICPRSRDGEPAGRPRRSRPGRPRSEPRPPATAGRRPDGRPVVLDDHPGGLCAGHAPGRPPALPAPRALDGVGDRARPSPGSADSCPTRSRPGSCSRPPWWSAPGRSPRCWSTRRARSGRRSGPASRRSWSTIACRCARSTTPRARSSTS